MIKNKSKITSTILLGMAAAVPATTLASSAQAAVAPVVIPKTGVSYASITKDAQSLINVNVNNAQEKALRDNLVKTAASQGGVMYLWGGASPTTGFDCSGLTSWSYAQNGIGIPRTADQQSKAMKSVSQSNVKPGDFVFFYDNTGHVYHVGMVLDPVKHTMWHAPNVNKPVQVGSWDASWYPNKKFGTVINNTQNANNVVTPPSSTTQGPIVNTPPNPVDTTRSPQLPDLIKVPNVATNTQTKVVYKANVLNVRAANNATSKITGTVTAGTKLTGTPMANGWLKITSGKYAGSYTSGAYLRNPAVKNNTSLNVRSSASATSQVAGVLKANTVVSGYEYNASWFKITSGVYTGKYVSTSYLN